MLSGLFRPDVLWLSDGRLGRDVSVSVANSSAEEQQRLLKELTEASTFTAWFIPTYHVVLVSGLIFIALWRSIAKAARRLKLVHGRDGHNTTISSRWRVQLTGSKHSDSEGASAKPDENSPLLSVKSNSNGRNKIGKLLLKLRSLAMFQPAPVPLVNKIIPSNATTFSILLLLGLNIFYLSYRIHFKFDLAATFADRAGMLFVSNLPWLYFLGAKNQPLQWFIGLSYEHLNIYHRRLGEWLCFLAVIHFAGMVCGWYSFLLPRGMEFLDFLTRQIILLGLGAFLSYEVLFFTSLASFRQWWYDLFLGSHIFLQASGLVLLFLHHNGSRIYTSIALAIFFVDHLVFRLGLKTRSFKADIKLLEDGETILVSADWPLTGHRGDFWSRLFRRDIKYGWTSAEHVFISVPTISRKHIVQAHPFTIASSAPTEGQQHAWLNLIVRARDGFTRDLRKHAEVHPSVQMRFDGPYGSGHAWHLLASSDLAIVVAGGSGIAVAYPLVWRLLQSNVESVDGRHGRHRRVLLIWVVHDASHVDWIGHERLDELKEKGLDVVIPPPTSKGGRPNLDTIVADEVKDLSHDEGGDKIGVVVSGPDSMNRGVRNTCARLAWKGCDVDIAVEKFGW